MFSGELYHPICLTYHPSYGAREALQRTWGRSQFLHTKAQQESDKHRQMCKDNEGKKETPPAYQFLAI